MIMKQNARNNSRGGNRFFSHLAAEKKKVALALCLISLMAFMWIKVLTKTSTQAADAELIAELMKESISLVGILIGMLMAILIR